MGVVEVAVTDKVCTKERSVALKTLATISRFAVQSERSFKPPVINHLTLWKDACCESAMGVMEGGVAGAASRTLATESEHVLRSRPLSRTHAVTDLK